MITLTLLHPVQSTPVQSWVFQDSSAVRIGRATENDVILYSAVVSRFHAELRCTEGVWELVNIGTNGTYLDGVRVQQVPLVDGSVIRLARSGPNIKVQFNQSEVVEPLPEAVKTSPASEPFQIEGAAVAERGTPPIALTQVSSQTADSFNTEPNRKTLPVNLEEQFKEAAPSSASQVLPLEPMPAMAEAQSSLGRASSSTTLTPSTEAHGCGHQRSQEKGLPFCADCGQPLNVSKKIGNYQIVKLIGTGSNTFVAWQSGRSVILKTLKLEQLAHPEAVELFKQRTKTLGQLSHPGLPEVYEAFEVNDQPFLVTEMIHDQNLHQWVSSQGPLSQAVAIAWMLEVCTILTYLHRQSPPVIHQGIKPGNLICRAIAHDDHRLALVDLADINCFTATQTMMKSIDYVAPEQQDGNVSPASDLYALGATLIYLLTGHQPSSFYRRDGQQRHLDPEHLSHLSQDLLTIVQKLTHFSPQERYASAAELATALRQVA